MQEIYDFYFSAQCKKAVNDSRYRKPEHNVISKFSGVEFTERTKRRQTPIINGYSDLVFVGSGTDAEVTYS